jgi:uncharacterized membrane-anchored protein
MRSKTLVQLLEKRHPGFATVRAFLASVKIASARSIDSLERAVSLSIAISRSMKLFAAGLQFSSVPD